MDVLKRSLGTGFAALFRGSLVSNIGDGIRLAALPLLATTLTSSKLLIGTVVVVQYVPWLVVAPAAGVIVDRWDRRQTILTTQAIRCVVMAALFLLVLGGHAAIWHLYIVAFVITSGEILVDPSIVALVPELVDDADLEYANGRIASAELITNDFAGAPVGGLAFGFSAWLPFVIDAVSYGGSILPFRDLPKSPRVDAKPAVDLAVVRNDAREGFDWLRRHVVLWPLTIAYIVYFAGVAATLSQLVVLLTLENTVSSFAFGVLLAVAAMGAFVGALMAGNVADRVGRRATLTGAVALQGVTMMAMAATDLPWLLFVIWFANGLPAGIQRPVSRSMQQRLTPNELLGRVNVTSRVFTRGVIIFAALLWSATAQAVGAGWSFVGAGAIEIVAAVLIYRALNTPAAKQHAELGL